MKIGVSAFAWTTKLQHKHLGLLPQLREHGFDGFEIPMFDPADIAALELRRAFEADKLECTVCAILPDGINPISPDAAVRKRSLAHLHRCIETAAEAGAHLIGGPLFAPIGYLPGRRRTEDEWSWAVECFQALGDALDSNAMTLAIEPVNRSESFFLNNGEGFVRSGQSSSRGRNHRHLSRQHRREEHCGRCEITGETPHARSR